MAKNSKAMTSLAKQFFDHTVHRRYVALVWGDFNEYEGTIRANVGRHQRFRKIFTAYPDGEYGKEAVTHYKVLERLNYVTVIECRLETGRTHQIRVHMQFTGHPIFNDELYGGDRIVKGTVFSKYKQFVDNCFAICQRQALHEASGVVVGLRRQPSHHAAVRQVIEAPLRQQRSLAEAGRGLHQDHGALAQALVVNLQTRPRDPVARHARRRDLEQQVVGNTRGGMDESSGHGVCDRGGSPGHQ